MYAQMSKIDWLFEWRALEDLDYKLRGLAPQYQVVAYRRVFGGSDHKFELIKWEGGSQHTANRTRTVVCEHTYEDMCNVLKMLVSVEYEHYRDKWHTSPAIAALRAGDDYW